MCYPSWGNDRGQKRIFYPFQTILRPKFFAEETKKIAEESLLSSWGNEKGQKCIFHLFQTILSPAIFAETFLSTAFLGY